jgi:hypothetical protein
MTWYYLLVRKGYVYVNGEDESTVDGQIDR